ncbi:hypothetical protein EVAR_88822_1 [Eumeta japonica]|uniref:Uncharacterized protein n=1 Tax=Eumeta variegata TaxID=151549 RepID=A0A4C1Y424_EUMVA|nr:hypothetical protein EVAR_88822_1 [Eumeta japonica]
MQASKQVINCCEIDLSDTISTDDPCEHHSSLRYSLISKQNVIRKPEPISYARPHTAEHYAPGGGGRRRAAAGGGGRCS